MQDYKKTTPQTLVCMEQNNENLKPNMSQDGRGSIGSHTNAQKQQLVFACGQHALLYELSTNIHFDVEILFCTFLYFLSLPSLKKQVPPSQVYTAKVQESKDT